MKKLVLIDGNAILHRAFHALPPLTSKNGEIVNAVYGFFSMFLKILEDQKPGFIIVCFDRAAPTFRQELFVGYQAHRPKTSSDLVSQIQFVHEILKKAKICTFELDGYEADDLIGTIATQAVRGRDGGRLKVENSNLKIEGKRSIYPQASTFKNLPSTLNHLPSDLEVIIVSGDRDLLQLVNSHVRMLAPITGLTNMLIYDSKLVKEKFGIEPSQIVDYKALVGDASDNYPGVAGIGPKTAANLLTEYKNLENIYKNLEKITKANEKLALKLAQGSESAGLAKKLAGIVTDVPITLDIEKCALTDLNKESLRKEFERFGFKSLLKRLDSKKEEKIESKPKKANEQLGLI